MKIALVQPPNPQRKGDWKKMRVSRPPINLALLAAYLRRFKHEPIIHDLDWHDGTAADMAKLILSGNPEVVGITCLTPRMEIALAIARRIKEISPDVKIILGGAHVNAMRERSLYTEDIDYAIYGEAEEALLDLVRALETHRGVDRIQNLIYRRNTRAVMNPPRPFIRNLDSLPFPAWDLLHLEEYIDPATFSGIHMGVMTSRGCPWDCIFCSSGVTWGRRVRFRSADNVLEELERIVHTLGIANIMFYDDTFTLNKPRFLKICAGIEKQKLALRYYCQLRADTVDGEVADALARSGCITAALGVESGDDAILEVLKKGFTRDQVFRAVAELKSAGVPILASYIIGSPGETHESVEKTFEFAHRLNTDQVKFMICTAFPGTELFDMAVRRGIVSRDLTPAQAAGITYYQHVSANLSAMSDRELLHYQKVGYNSFIPKPSKPSRKLKKEK